MDAIFEQVYDYLSVMDVLELCKFDDYFKELVEKKCLNLLELGIIDGEMCLESFFRELGKYMRRVSVNAMNMNTLLEFIIKYCELNKFTEITIYNHGADELDLKVINDSMPYFSNLHKFSFRNVFAYLNENLGIFLKQFSTAAPNLRILELTQVDVEGGWLGNLQNLNELHIHGSEKLSFDDLTTCLMANSKLKVFDFSGDQDITTVGDILSKRCPDLTVFSDIHTNNPYSNFDDAVKQRYDFLSSFAKLNCVTLTTYTFSGYDLYYPLKNLETKKISTLKVYVSCKKVAHLTSMNVAEKERIFRLPLPHFACLRNVGLHIGRYYDDWRDRFDNDAKWIQIDLRCKFMLRFMSQCTQIENCTFYSERLGNVYKIIQFVPRLRSLFIANVRLPLSDMKNELQSIVATLRSNRQSNNSEHLLHLALNDTQWDILKTVPDFQDFVTTKVYKT